MAFNSRNDTYINTKIRFEGLTHRFKLPLRELIPSTLQDKVSQLLGISQESKVVLERYSDSTRTYVVLDPNNISTYKQLHRAARAKLRLRLRASIIHNEKGEFIREPSAKDEKNPVQDLVPGSADSDNMAPMIKNKTFSTTECQYQSNVINSISDIQNCLQKLRIDDYVNNAVSADQAIFTSYERDSHNSAPISEPDTAYKIKCCHIFDNQDSSHVKNTNSTLGHSSLIPKKYTTDQRTCKDFEDKNISPSFSEFYTLTVFCNNCSSLISGEHYHCSNCEGGDYDLCQKCVENGTLCNSEDHWLIKRFIRDGKPVNSITETISHKTLSQSNQTNDDNQRVEILVATRTCNCCVTELTEENFVTCTTCPDFDLCMSCHVGLNHGHHPKHAFEPVIKDRSLDPIAQSLLAPGRNVEHDATCDGCDKVIYGIRHKCLDCPDWDYCSSCITDAKTSHPRHIFFPIYEKFDYNLESNRSCPYKATIRHHGVFCDGPLCQKLSTYITGDRYKCALCDDIDFCARCEASTQNTHNSKHPLIKFKYPVPRVSIKTYKDSLPILSDENSKSCLVPIETSPAISTNSEIQVQTIFDLKPIESLNAGKEDKIDQTWCEKKEPLDLEPELIIVAHFVRDIIVDGTVMLPNVDFEQTWYLRNAGETAWPPGCYVKLQSGTDMLSIGNECSEKARELTSKSQSSIFDANVAPGQVVGFTVSLKSPNSPGNYISFWRLVTPSGRLVGPKLWCEINVKERISVVNRDSTDVNPVEGSKMVFPTLEKESVSPRIHQNPIAHSVDDDEFWELSEGNVSDEDLLDLSLSDDEYDILDLSDEEYIGQQQETV